MPYTIKWDYAGEQHLASEAYTADRDGMARFCRYMHNLAIQSRQVWFKASSRTIGRAIGRTARSVRRYKALAKERALLEQQERRIPGTRRQLANWSRWLITTTKKIAAQPTIILLNQEEADTTVRHRARDLKNNNKHNKNIEFGAAGSSPPPPTTQPHDQVLDDTSTSVDIKRQILLNRKTASKELTPRQVQFLETPG